ncbi:hypothetical protein [Paraburkholderia sp. BCC1886]|uniref:hypothetical protein n=1 Tax=Paraburkholderia sp. BCC1886 TaxID=2562670 RepID=UPI001182BCC8|nr:hypothetical protein [Paraburkholderia sp. BCC1886]
MITNVPTSADYYTSGKELLNFAWDTTANLLIEFDQADYYGYDEAEILDAYWVAAKRTLTTALTIVQQAVELIIKGRIVEVSPYLLISDFPSRWPSPYDGRAVDFELFRTIDAQDLIRVHDTFADEAFDANFVEKFHNLRAVRNVVIHSAGKNVSVPVAEVIDSALYMHKALFPNESWFSIRREFLRRAPSSQFGADEFATNTTCWEASIVVKLLPPAKVEAYLGIDTRQRLYLCPECLYDANTDGGFDHKLAVLRPKAPGSTNLYCPVCDQTHSVVRKNCTKADCPGSVIAEEYKRCLTCSSWQDDEGKDES